jgi:hypothetical protein
LFKLAWDGSWEEGDAEILRHIKIKNIENINDQ